MFSMNTLRSHQVDLTRIRHVIKFWTRNIQTSTHGLSGIDLFKPSCLPNIRLQS